MVAVGAVVLDKEHRTMLMKHVEAKREGFWFGKWICLGGKLETGENMTEGAVREVKEETNLDIETSGRAITFDRIVKENAKTRLHVVYVDFVARAVSGDLKPSSDVGLARWFNRKELEDRWGELHQDTQRLIKESGVLEKDASIVV